MRTSKLAAIVLSVLILPLWLACRTHEGAEVSSQSQEQAPTANTEKEVPGTDKESDLNPVSAQMMVDDVTIGHHVATDGTIAATDQGDDFAPGETVNVTMKVADAPAGSVVRVLWYGPGEKKINEDSKTVEAGAQYLPFQADTTSWKKGDYRAEVWVGDEKVNTQEFQVVDKDDAGK